VAVSDAANRIDQILRRSGDTEGESRDGSARLLIEAPLSVLFEVEPLDRRIHVIAVHRWPPAR
jgi:hypothetical protein